MFCNIKHGPQIRGNHPKLAWPGGTKGSRPLSRLRNIRRRLLSTKSWRRPWTNLYINDNQMSCESLNVATSRMQCCPRVVSALFMEVWAAILHCWWSAPRCGVVLLVPHDCCWWRYMIVIQLRLLAANPCSELSRELICRDSGYEDARPFPKDGNDIRARLDRMPTRSDPVMMSSQIDEYITLTQYRPSISSIDKYSSSRIYLLQLILNTAKRRETVLFDRNPIVTDW
jgi:hypothetical protein